jgi:hypothetical protein
MSSVRNYLLALKGNIRELLRASEIIMSRDPPKSQDLLVIWLDDVMNKLLRSLPNDDKYSDLRQNAVAIRKMVYVHVSQDPYYLRAMAKLIIIIREAPEPPIPDELRAWIDKHFSGGGV